MEERGTTLSERCTPFTSRHNHQFPKKRIMGKKTLVNAQTDQDVNEFLDAVKNKKRREYGKALLDIMKEITGKEPKIW